MIVLWLRALKGVKGSRFGVILKVAQISILQMVSCHCKVGDVSEI